MLTNIIGGLQGIVDHVMVGHYVGFTGNAAIGVANQIFIVVIVFIMSLFTGMSILVARHVGARDALGADRVVYQAFITAIALSLGVLAPIGYFLRQPLLALRECDGGGAGRGAAVPADLLPLLGGDADLLHAEWRTALGRATRERRCASASR